MYHDRNRDCIRQSTSEELLPGAQLRLSNLTGNFVVTGTTLSFDRPFCFRDLSGGTYVVREANPSGYVSTTEDIWGAVVTGNFTVTVPFGDVAVATEFRNLPLILRSLQRSN